MNIGQPGTAVEVSFIQHLLSVLSYSTEIEDTVPSLKNKLYGLTFAMHLFDSCRFVQNFTPTHQPNPTFHADHIFDGNAVRYYLD
jgi:hypothetical protein